MQNRCIPERMQDLMNAAHSGRVSGADQNGSSIFLNFSGTGRGRPVRFIDRFLGKWE